MHLSANKSISILFILFLILSMSILDAHPHMMFYPRMNFIINDDYCTGVEMDWEFDSMFSRSIIDGFDKNKNNLFETDEIKNIYDRAFLNLRNYHYFLVLQTENDKFHPNDISEFSASQNNGKLFYHFLVSFEGLKLYQDFSLSIFDPTFFSAVSYKDEPVTFSSINTTKQPTYEFKTDRGEPYYYDPQGAVEDTTVHKSWKPGLKTAYPEVLYVKF